MRARFFFFFALKEMRPAISEIGTTSKPDGRGYFRTACRGPADSAHGGVSIGVADTLDDMNHQPRPYSRTGHGNWEYALRQ